MLGTKRTVPKGKFEQIAKTIEENKIQGLALIGGFEAFETVLMLSEQRDKYPQFRIPMVVLPATISNNVPGDQNDRLTKTIDLLLKELTSPLGLTPL